MDGATCDLRGIAAAEEDCVQWRVTPAIADLDGDGNPEIATAAATRGLVAFRWDPPVRNIVRLCSRVVDAVDDQQTRARTRPVEHILAA